jgi:enoyl-CoA hydratase/carnithine racemase
MTEPLVVGAVAYTPNVVPIWEGIREYFRDSPAPMDFVLFSNYGRQVDARRAYEIGLIDLLYGPGEVESQTRELAEEICARAQFSVRSTKYIIRLILEGQADDDEETLGLRNGSFDTEDYQEGVRAFLEKRSPNFTYS